MLKTKAPPAPQESPEAKARREAEEKRADTANLRNTQEVLRQLTGTRRRRFGLVKAPVQTGSQQSIVGGLAGLMQSAAAGGMSAADLGGDALGSLGGFDSSAGFFYDFR